MINKESIEVSGIRVDMVGISQIVAIMNEWIRNKSYHNYIIVS